MHACHFTSLDQQFVVGLGDSTEDHTPKGHMGRHAKRHFFLYRLHMRDMAASSQVYYAPVMLFYHKKLFHYFRPQQGN